jgi:amino acid permease
VASQARGSIFAFIICMVVLIGGFALIFTGRSVDGLIAILSGLTVLSGVFVYSKYQQKKEREDKANALATARKRN